MSGKNRLTGETAVRANKLLKTLAVLLEKNGVRYCLDGGTLLGIVREDRLLPWDNDIDLFLPVDQSKKVKALRWSLRKIGCRLKESVAVDNYGPIKKGTARIYKVISPKGADGQQVIIDLIFKTCDEDDYHWVVGVKRVVHKKVSRRYYDKFDEIMYQGQTYPIPSNVDEYLTARYGDWRQPKKAWDFRADDLAIKR